jgi:hypothetical protein
MRYRVRTPDGELDYGSMRDVEVAYIQGLVGPDDEVREEGKEVWRKASSIPSLARVRPEKKRPMPINQQLSIVGAVFLGVAALACILSGSLMLRVVAFLLTLAMSALLFQVTTKAFKRPGPR